MKFRKLLKDQREKLSSPTTRLAIAAAAIGYGVRIIVDRAKQTERRLEALGQNHESVVELYSELAGLHAETRTRVFQLETVEEAKRAVAPEHPSVPAGHIGGEAPGGELHIVAELEERDEMPS